MTRTPDHAAGATERRRDGFTIALALISITVIGGLIAGIFYASTQELRISRNTMLLARAQGAAESGLHLTYASTWSQRSAAYQALPVGGVDSGGIYANTDGSTTTVRVTRISGGTFPLFLVASRGRAGANAVNQAERQVSTLLTVNRLRMNMLGALTTHGSTKIGGSSYIDGMDTTTYGLTGWNCPPPAPGSAKPGIAIDNTSNIQTSGCSGLRCVDGNPDLYQTTAAADSNTYFSYGNNTTWNSLVAMAKIVTSNPNGPSLLNNVCNTADPGNWGDPNHALPTGPCEGYFPILYAPGDLHVTGGSGQGILLVGGNLHVTGGFEFYGPVIVRGDMDTQGTGGHFNGGVMAANVNLAQNTVLGNAVVKYSSCIINQVLNNVSPPVTLSLRAWSEGF